MTETEAYLLCGDKLSSVVYLPRLVSQIFSIAAPVLDEYELDPSITSHAFFLAHTLPEVPVALLPRTIYSEKDVANWCDSTIFKPALAALRAVEAGKITLEDVPIHPYLSSAPHRSIIPDGLLVVDDDPLTAVLTIEYKSEHVLEDIFADLQNKPFDMDEGAAVLFNWPKPSNMSSCDGRSRVLVQVRGSNISVC